MERVKSFDGDETPKNSSGALAIGFVKSTIEDNIARMGGFLRELFGK